MPAARTEKGGHRAATDLRVHPRASLVPELAPAEYQALLADTRERGIVVPLDVMREAMRAGSLPHLCLGRYRRYEVGAIKAWLVDQRGQSREGREQ
jgi:hypothetical protein